MRSTGASSSSRSASAAERSLRPSGQSPLATARGHDSVERSAFEERLEAAFVRDKVEALGRDPLVAVIGVAVALAAVADQRHQRALAPSVFMRDAMMQSA